MCEVNILCLLCVLWNVWWDTCVWYVLIAFFTCGMSGVCVCPCAHMYMHVLDLCALTVCMQVHMLMVRGQPQISFFRTVVHIEF